MSARQVRKLNDRFRTTMTGGQVILTPSVDALPADVKALVIDKVATYSDFTTDNDRRGEHAFGAFSLGDRMFFWQIDYCDGVSQTHDRTNPSKKNRVLTIGSIPAASPKTSLA